VLSAEQVKCWQSLIPELPGHRRKRLVEEYGIPDYDAGVLAAEREIADYFEAVAEKSSNPKAVSNWIMTEMMRLLAEKNMSISNIAMTPDALGNLVKMVDEGVINHTTAKEVFSVLFEQGGVPSEIVSEKGMAQLSDSGEIAGLVDRAMAEHPQSVADYRKGKKAAAKFLVGQVMRLSGGKADPRLVSRLVQEKLA
jgi:aspartyl-tRNA(Asn)/glutamyl-tRNA(Gln) amidotransferase subunit B